MRVPKSAPGRARVLALLLLAALLGGCSPGQRGSSNATPRPTPSASGPVATSPSVPPGASASPSATASATAAAGPLLRFAAVGDVGDGSTREARVARRIAETHAGGPPLDVLLLLGDLIYPDGEPDQYKEKFADPYEPVLTAGIPLLAALGNHDIRTSIAGVEKAFGMPGPYFTVVRGPVEFFVLDTSRGSVDHAQLAWFEDVLKASTAPWKVALMHVPLFSSGSLHGSNPQLQASLRPLFETYRVQLVLGAHDHNYERTVAMNGVTYIVSGGGCCPREVGRSPFTAATAAGLHFVVFDVQADLISLVALDPSGAILDRARILREPAAATP